jgi:hypothetical protein
MLITDMWGCVGWSRGKLVIMAAQQLTRVGVCRPTGLITLEDVNTC